MKTKKEYVAPICTIEAFVPNYYCKVCNPKYVGGWIPVNPDVQPTPIIADGKYVVDWNHNGYIDTTGRDAENTKNKWIDSNSSGNFNPDDVYIGYKVTSSSGNTVQWDSSVQYQIGTQQNSNNVLIYQASTWKREQAFS